MLVKDSFSLWVILPPAPPLTDQLPGQKMFQLWKLLLLCGLLAGTSASFLEDLRGKLDNVFNKLKPDLEKGAETIDKALEGESTRAIRSGSQEPAS